MKKKSLEQPPAPVEKKTDQQETNLEMKEFMDAHFEALILAAERFNEGQEGIIAKLDLSIVDKEVQEQMLGEGYPETSALKLLKVYSSGKAKAEYETQLTAYEILSQHPDAAQVPRPYLYRDVELVSEEAQAIIQNRYDGAGGQNHVEILIMDLIDGDDLATVAYKEVLKRHRRTVHVRNRVDDMRYTDIQSYAQEVLGFDRPGGKGKTAQEKAFEEHRVFEANANLLFKFLSENDYSLPKEVRQKVEKALQILHEAGVYHRDLHMRNIMIGNDGEVYIIDFGKSLVRKENDRHRGGDIYKIDEERDYLTDDSILDVCKKLEGQAWMEVSDELQGVVEQRSLDPYVSTQLENLENTLRDRNIEITDAILRRFISNTLAGISPSVAIENEAFIVVKMADESEAGKEAAIGYLESRLAEKTLDDDLRELLEKAQEKLKGA